MGKKWSNWEVKWKLEKKSTNYKKMKNKRYIMSAVDHEKHKIEQIVAGRMKIFFHGAPTNEWIAKDDNWFYRK